MTSDRSYVVNGQRIKELRRLRKLTQAQLADALDCSVDTVKRLEKGHSALRITVEALATFFGVRLDELTEESRTVRDVSGGWTVIGEDVVVPGLFDYAVAPKSFRAAIIIEQHGRRIFASGRDQDNDPLTVEAEMADDGNYISGRYEIRNERLRLTGVFTVKYLNLGNRMRGFYLQRDTEHESDIVLGRLLLEADPRA